MRAALGIAVAVGVALAATSCKYESYAHPDVDATVVPEPPPPPLTEPGAGEVDQELRICLSGKSHPTHIGKERSRMFFRRLKRWPDKYEEALPGVYQDMLHKDQAPGSHVDFCVHAIAGGDDEREARMHKRIKQVRLR